MTADPTDSSSAPVRPSDREADRLEALQAYDILDTPPEEAFDRITDLAAHLFDAPVAVINFIDDDRQWFKSCTGLDRTEVGLDVSFCARTVRQGDVMVVEDATADPRFVDDPMVVGEPGMRFYAGAPLVTPDGYGLGTICVFDTEPQSPSDATVRQLSSLADMVVDELELRRQVSERTRTEEKVRRIVENAQPVVFMVDREGTFLLSEGRDLAALDLEPGEAVGASVHDMFAGHPTFVAVIDHALDGDTASDVVTIDGTTFDMWCAPFHDATGDVAGGIGMAVDITERQQAQAELEQHRDRLRRAQEIANVGGWEYDARSDTLTWTEELYRIHERAPERGIDLDAAIGYYTDDARSTVRDIVASALEDGEGWQVELPIETETGERRWIRSFGHPRYDGDTLVKIVGAAQDITEQHEAEEALRKSERRHREFMERSPVGIYRSTADGELLYANDALVNMLGADSLAALQQHNLDAEGFGLSDRTALIDELDEEGTVRRKETTWTGPDGTTVELLESAHVIEEDGSRIYEGVVENITERKRAERQLRESNQRQRLALEAADAGTFEYDATTGRSNWDKRTLCIYGLDGDNVSADTAAFYSRVHPDDRADLQATLEDVIETEDRYAVSYRVVRPSGEVRHVLSHGIIERNDAGDAQRIIGLNLDVTERKEAEQELRRSRERWQRLVSAHRDPIQITVDGIVKYINPAGAELFGASTPREIIGMSILAFTTSDAVSDTLRERKERLDCGEPTAPLEHEIERLDGERRIIVSYSVPIEYDDRAAAQTVLRDVTEQREAERALRRSRQKYKSLFDASNEAIFIHDLDGTIRDVNSRACSLFGYSHEAFVGRNVADLVPDGESRADGEIQTVREGGAIHKENRYEHRDGTPFWGELSATAFEIEGETLVQGMIRDVTDRKEAEKARRESEARLRGLANSVPGIIFQFYARPDGEYGMHFVSEQAETVLGLDTDPDGFFERFADRIDPSHQEEFLASVSAAVEQAELWNLEFPFCKPSGETIWAQGIATPEERDDELVFNGVLLDITKRKQLQSQLRQAQKMETVGTLAGGIAHDFNNILHAATVYLRMGLEDLPESHSTYDFLIRAEKGLKRAESLVDKLLTFSRQEGKTVEEAVDVAHVIEETVELVESSVPNHVEMRTAINDECCVMGDPGQLQQVAMNLLTNAAQALQSQEDGTDSVLDIEVRSMEVDEDLASRYLNLNAGRYVRLSISDTGPGMDPDTKERIFEPFFTTKEVGKGTGLGLSVVHGIVQAHEGEITVFTQPGQGTTFNVYIPCASENAAADATGDATGDADDAPTEHVLFVDDDDQVVDLESVRLHGFGYEVSTHQTAQDALDAIEEHPEAFDLVLTDYAMPGMNGLTLIRTLRDRGYTMPIILMSGFSAKVSEEEVLQAGAEMFLRKPVGSSEMEDALDTALNGPASA